MNAEFRTHRLKVRDAAMSRESRAWYRLTLGTVVLLALAPAARAQTPPDTSSTAVTAESCTCPSVTKPPSTSTPPAKPQTPPRRIDRRACPPPASTGCCPVVTVCPPSAPATKDVGGPGSANVALKVDVTLGQAQRLYRDGRFEDARKLFFEAGQIATDRSQIKTAMDGYAKAWTRTDEPLWRFGLFAVPLRWFLAERWPPELWLLIALIILLLLAGVSPRILPGGRGAAFWLGTGVHKVFMPRFLGRAHIVEPVKLTKDAETALFAQALQSAFAAEVHRRLGRAGGGSQAPAGSMLSLPSVVVTVLQDTPSVKGVEIGKIIKILFTLARYFGWRVESQVAFRPAVKNDGGGPAVPARMRAAVSLRWAWVQRTWIDVERDVLDQYDVSGVAFAVAARLRGLAFGDR